MNFYYRQETNIKSNKYQKENENLTANIKIMGVRLTIGVADSTVQEAFEGPRFLQDDLETRSPPTAFLEYFFIKWSSILIK